MIISIVKKTTAVVLLVSMIYLLAGYSVVLFTLQSAVKYKIKELIRTNQIEPSAITMIKIDRHNQKNLIWYEDNEFYLDGKMYDIIKKDSRTDAFYYLCYYDAEETQLVNCFDKYLKDLLSTNSAVKSMINKLTVYLFVDDSGYTLYIGNNCIYLQSLYTDYTSIILDINPPPPKPAAV